MYTMHFQKEMHRLKTTVMRLFMSISCAQIRSFFYFCGLSYANPQIRKLTFQGILTATPTYSCATEWSSALNLHNDVVIQLNVLLEHTLNVRSSLVLRPLASAAGSWAFGENFESERRHLQPLDACDSRVIERPVLFKRH